MNDACTVAVYRPRGADVHLVAKVCPNKMLLFRTRSHESAQAIAALWRRSLYFQPGELRRFPS